MIFKNSIFLKSYPKFLLLIKLFLISQPFISKESLHFFWKRNEYDFLEDYLKSCSNEDILNFTNIQKSKMPKVSIISAVYNKAQYLLRFIHSIQLQNFFEYEMILIDDCSTDNSVELIKKFKKNDPRISLIKNNKNYGTFKSRNLGAMKSTGIFVIFPDPDDILSKNSLRTFYNYAIKYNYEMIRYNLYIGNKELFMEGLINQINCRAIFQPELSTYIFYGLGFLRQIDFNLSNKMIKRISYIKALNSLKEEYLNIHMTIFEDGVLNYILYKYASSLYFIKRIGYYYIKNPQSITKKKFDSKAIKAIFIHLKIVYEYSKNKKYEKDMFNEIFDRICIKNNVTNIINSFNIESDYEFYIKTLNKFMNNEFLNINNKKYIFTLKNIL